MKKIFIVFMILPMLLVSVNAQQIEAPQAPSSSQEYMPHESQSLGDGLVYILSKALSELLPSISEAMQTGAVLIAAVLLLSFIGSYSSTTMRVAELVGIVFIASVLLQSANTLIHLGTNTITELDSYGKLLIPVMTTALASQGGVTKSAALYAGTTLFSSVLTTVLSKLFLPMIYIYLALCIANRAVGQDVLSSIKKFIKWLMSWMLKIVLYIFTGYITLTGVVSGSADAIALKATKITVSGMVPVVGSIISDASEAILISADVMKNTAGIYGIFAFLAICIGPFLKIAVQYILLKAIAAICGIFGVKNTCGLIEDFSQTMGLLLAATGSICLMLLITTVVFMKGVQ